MKKLAGGAIKGKHQNHDKQRAKYGTWKCHDCEFIGKTRRELEQHRRELHSAHKAWNKGLTKETDIRVANNAKSVKASMKKLYENGYNNPNSPFCSSYWTDEKKSERSKQKKELFKKHPEKHPNRKLAGNRKQMTYPEKLAFDWLTQHNIEFIHSYHFISDKIERYVDFYIPVKKLFIEIDGEHWHKVDNSIDIQKDIDAYENGFKTLRIRFPSMNVNDSLNKEFKL